VQEIWEAETRDKLEDAAKDAFADTYFPPPMPSEEEGACGVEDLGGIQECATACEGQEGIALITCLTAACQSALPNADCSTCLLGNIVGGLEKVYDECLSYAYGGSYGLGLLTTGAIRETDFRPYDAVFSRRGILYARVEYEGVDWDVFCTHTTAAFPQLPYPGEADSWENELATQVDTILAYVEEKRDDDRPTLLLGDFNTGPKTDTADAKLASNYERIVNAGYESPYVTEVGDCTNCADNPIAQEPLGGESTDSPLIDHVFTKGVSAASAERILDDPITITVDGKKVEAAYSDHYGVLVEVER
jgi:endonuclease/exonuclease/phosphatase family metal-dependent hydrolase